MSRRLSRHFIDEVRSQMKTEEVQKPKSPAELLAEHAENLRPKRQPLQNDFMSKPGRWNGVAGGPQGLKQI
jgi:hypothetical protein